MTKGNLIKTAICFFLLLLCALSVYGISKNMKEYESLGSEKHSLERNAKTAKQGFDEYRKDVQQQAYDEAEEKEGEGIEAKEVAKHNNAYSVMNNLSEGFFDIFFTWEDSETYNERAEKAKEYASAKVINNDYIFDDGKDSLGDDYVKTSGVKSEFVNAEAYPADTDHALVKVNYKSWYDDEKRGSGESTRYYYVSFDRDNTQIRGLDLVFSSDDD